MLLVMDDINDELFRRAADNYPLKTDTPDWDAVLNKMNTAGPSGDTDPVPKKRNKNYRYLLLLLLLIPFAVYENRNSGNDINAGEKNKIINTAEPGKNQAANAGTPAEGSNKTTDNNPQNINPGNKDNPGAQNNSSNNNNIAQNNTTVPVKPIETQTQQEPATADINYTNNKTTAANNNNNNTNSHLLPVKSNRVNPSVSKQRARVKINNALLTAGDENNNGAALAKQNRKKKLSAKSSAAITLTSPETESDAAGEKVADADNEKKIRSEKDIPVTATKEAEPANKIKQDSSVTPQVKEKEVAKTDEKKSTKEDKKKKRKNKTFLCWADRRPRFQCHQISVIKKSGH